MSRSASYGVLLDHAQDKILVVDETGRITYANAAVERLLGVPPEEVIGQNVFDAVHPDDTETVRSTFQQTIEADTYTTTSCEYRYWSAEGRWVWLESRMSNLTDDELDGYVVSSRDITDRVAAKQEQQETMERLQELSRTTGEVLWMFNGDWSELLFVNPAIEDVYGVSGSAVEADPTAFIDAIHPEDVPAVEEAMACLSAGESVDIEYRVNPERDYKVWVWVQAEPIIEDGEVVRITGFSRDVTDRYRRERQLYVMDNLLRHNLRNDVNTILGNARLIEDDAPEVADRTAVIRRTGEQLLASAQKERDIIEILTTRPEPKQVDLVDAITDGIETVQERYPAADIEVSLPERATACAIDELRIAILELIENAIAHAEGRETASVSLDRQDGTWELTVADRAPPMPEMEAQVLRGEHEMTDIYHSTGLGLWLVYWVVELSDGEMSVENPESGGNRVILRLPTV